jgi:hypothetical protein
LLLWFYLQLARGRGSIFFSWFFFGSFLCIKTKKWTEINELDSKCIANWATLGANPLLSGSRAPLKSIKIASNIQILLRLYVQICNCKALKLNRTHTVRGQKHLWRAVGAEAVDAPNKFLLYFPSQKKFFKHLRRPRGNLI